MLFRRLLRSLSKQRAFGKEACPDATVLMLSQMPSPSGPYMPFSFFPFFPVLCPLWQEGLKTKVDALGALCRGGEDVF